jgi:hypothetical protein
MEGTQASLTELFDAAAFGEAPSVGPSREPTIARESSRTIQTI